VTFGHATAAGVRRHFRSIPAAIGATPDDWYPELRQRLEAYAAGSVDDFADVELAQPEQTSFQIRVLTAVRRVGFGTTISYGELARRAGSARAARAAGQIMAQNTVPVIVPCHRVVGACGTLGGYSGPGGVRLKQRLLDLEQATLRH
jgi:methylated-DNA-[protein]-cysteine S-methyltransferase